METGFLYTEGWWLSCYKETTNFLQLDEPIPLLITTENGVRTFATLKKILQNEWESGARLYQSTNPIELELNPVGDIGTIAIN